jgi:hypothetical protein
MGARRKSLLTVVIAVLATLSLFVVGAMAAKSGLLFYAVRLVLGSVSEAQRYYTVTGTPDTRGGWMERFGFQERQQGESLQDWRQRTGVAVYYNRTELALGRELGCGEFLDGYDSAGLPLVGLACFVTNYGDRFGDATEALADAIAGRNPKNTVAITYRPSLPSQYAVQVAVYGSEGDLQPNAQLDIQGPRPMPQICSNCHGGTYDPVNHLMMGSQFQPINEFIITFSDVAGYTAADQAERIARLNELVLTIPRGGRCPLGQTFICTTNGCRCVPS